MVDESPSTNEAEAPECLPGGGPESDFWVRLWVRVGIVLVLAGQGMVFGLGLNTAEPPLTPESPIYWILHGGLLMSALIALALLGGPLLRETWATLRRGRLSVESLFTISMLGAFVGSLLTSVRGEGAVYYEVVAVVLSIYTVGKALGVRGKSRALAEAAKLEAGLDVAKVETRGGLRPVSVSELSPEDVVVVAPGGVIPVDGTILRGSAYVQEQALTGEPAPVARGVGDAVLAGTYPLDGTIYIQAKALVGARRIDDVIEAVRGAREKPSRLQRDADRLTRVFVPLVCTVSLVTFFGWMPFVGWAEALFNAMAVLIVACPCALGLATPAAVWLGLASLARYGLVARQGDILEDLSRARIMVFDKTGTLSHEQLAVSSCRFYGNWKAQQGSIAAGLAAIEAPQGHPVGQALLQWAKERMEGSCPEILSTHFEPAQGIAATLKTEEGAQEWRIGSPAFAFGDSKQAIAAGEVCLSVNAQPVARFTISETLRPGVKESFDALRQEGLSLAILSGDPAPGWDSVAGVSVEAGLTPTEKTARIQALRKQHGRLIFVGDGVNDAPAMAEADAAIALDSGAGLSVATAGAVLQGGNISALPQALIFSKKLMVALRGNLRFALLYNTLGMILAAGGVLHPVLAAILMLGSSAFVSGRVFRAAAQ